ncbi:MAG: hypothetical protein QX198_03465 [Methylococcaceae bacterium]
MKRNKITESPCQDRVIGHKQRVAFHEAGHAAGIHLNNKAKHLPPIFFKIIFKDINDVTAADALAHQTSHDDCIAHVEGGRLIEMLPPPLKKMELAKEYMLAFEADIINLLIGPLAEAKHVADTDAELFNQQLVNVKALKNYGGSYDLALVNEYLQSLSVDKQQRDEKLDELFTVAFDFVNNAANWTAITKLADYILRSNKNIICCEEIMSIVDQSVELFHSRRTKTRNAQHG